MKIKHKFAFAFLTSLAVILSVILYMYAMDSAMVNPKGIIALKERDLMIAATLLMLVVVIPVFVLTFYICWQYRSSNKEAIYAPEWDHSISAELIWWGFPLMIITVLSLLTLETTYELDPFRPLESDVKPLKIQVVALQWKWLFIYPEQKIATVNYFQIPEKTPINFEITAEAPMNSFWIPQLGGQIYAMPGMNTKLHLIADEPGNYRGSSANISGTGFAGMVFTARATSEADFNKWVESAKTSKEAFGAEQYKALVEPSEYNPEATYALKDADLFNQIVMKYMMPPMQPDAAHKEAVGIGGHHHEPSDAT